MSVTIPIAVLIGGCLGIAVLTGAIIIMYALLREGEREADRQQAEIYRLRRKWLEAHNRVRSLDQHAADAIAMTAPPAVAVAVAKSVRWVEPTAADLAAWSQQTGYDWREQ